MNIYIYFSVFVIVYQLTPLAAVRVSENEGYEKTHFPSKSKRGVWDYLNSQPYPFVPKPLTTSIFRKPLESPYGDYYMSHSLTKRDVAMELLKGVGKVIGQVGWHEATKNIDPEKLLTDTVEYVDKLNIHPHYRSGYMYASFLPLVK